MPVSDYHQKKHFSYNEQYKSLALKLPGFIRSFLASKESQYGIHTLIAYTYEYLYFTHYLILEHPAFKGLHAEDVSTDEFSKLTEQDLRCFIDYARAHETVFDERDDEGTKKSKEYTNEAGTINRKLTALNGLFRQLVIQNDILENPLERIERMKCREADDETKYLEVDEVRTLLDGVMTGLIENASPRQLKYLEKTRERDIALILLLLNTGIRVSECIGLNFDDISLERRELLLPGDPAHREYIYFNQTTADALRAYMYGSRKQMKAAKGHEQALFLSSMQNKRISDDAVQNLIRKYGEYTGMPIKITPKNLRRTYGTTLYNQLHDLEAVQHQLRHKSIETTSRYYVKSGAKRRRQISDLDIY